jgi:glycosyltransferase involved in cell wall biosynthesis
VNVLLVEPPRLHPARGNAATVARWARGLAALGHGVVRAGADALDDLDLAGRPPHLVHAHHALHCGPQALARARALGVPLVVSVGGTDLYGADGTPPPEAGAVFGAADLVVGPFPGLAASVAAASDRAVGFRTVRRGVDIPSAVPAARTGGAPLRLVLVGGLRPVKGQREAVELVAALRARGLSLELDLVGPALDAGYARAVEEALAGRPGMRWRGVVAPERMGEVYRDADALLNTSRLEGAANAVLEAWAHGRPVLARAAPGNRELLEDAPGEAACLFADGADGWERAEAWLRRLAAEDAEARRRRAGAAYDHVRACHDAWDEARELAAAYRGVLEGGR